MNNENNNKSSLTPALAEKIISLQEKELILRSQELDIRKQNDFNNHEFAKASLEANLKDREAARKYSKSSLNSQLIFIFFIVIIIFCFLVISLYLNKEQIALEVIKVIIYGGLGGLGGYAYRESKTKEKTQ